VVRARLRGLAVQRLRAHRGQFDTCALGLVEGTCVTSLARHRVRVRTVEIVELDVFEQHELIEGVVTDHLTGYRKVN
jgi:hypothetical protein